MLISDFSLWTWIAILTLYLVGVAFVAGVTWPNFEGWGRIVAVVFSTLSWVGLAIALGSTIFVVTVTLIARSGRFLARKLYHFGGRFAEKVGKAATRILYPSLSE